MKKAAVAGLLAGALAVPLAAQAAQYLLVDQVGQPVAVVVPMPQHAVTHVPVGFPMAAFPFQVGFPVANMFAQQDAMIRRMMSDFSPLPTMGADASGGMAGPGSMITVSSFSSAKGSCSRTVVYREQPNGAAPVVQISQSGDACGVLPTVNPPASVPVAAPETDHGAQIAPGGTKLYRIGYRNHKLAAPAIRG